MPDWKAVPVFGVPDTHLPSIVRPSACAHIRDSLDRLAIIRTGTGSYLPGGGILDTESAEDAVRREAREECGLEVLPGSWRRAAIDHVTVPREEVHFEKRSVFYDAAVVAQVSEPAESGHLRVWLPPREAFAALTPPSHRWAVTEWIADQANSPRLD